MSRKHRAAKLPRTVETAPAVPAPASRRTVLLIAAGLVVLTLAVYAPVRHYDFVQLDDPVQVTENPQVTAGLTWRGVAWAFTSARAGYWMPLVWLSHMADVQLYGVRAGGHHVTNVALHLACTLLLFGLLVHLTGALYPSAFVAALFAVHPLHVESVAWITERKDVLNTVFWMLTLWAYVSWTRCKQGSGIRDQGDRLPPIPDPRSLRLRYLLVLALFALGLMAKPMLVTLPVVMLLLDVWPLGRAGAGRAGRAGGAGGKRWRALIWEKLPLFALAVAGAVIAFVTQQQAGAVGNLQAYPLGLRVENALVSYVAYIGKMFWPVGLTVLYPLRESISASSVAGALVVLALVSLVALRSMRRRPYIAVGWLWYVVTLLPVIGLVQIGVQGMADRFTYVPLIGLFIIVAWIVPDLLARWPARGRVLPAIAAVIVLACAWGASAQVRYWKDNTTLFTRTTELTLNVDAYHAHMSLGGVLRDQGRLDEAATHFAEAVQSNPRSVEAHNNLAVVLTRQGKVDDAIAHYTEALRLNPALAELHSNLGALLANQGKPSDAIPHFAEAVRLKPDFEIAHLGLALACARTGRTDDAVREFNEVLRINPANEVARRAVGR